MSDDTENLESQESYLPKKKGFLGLTVHMTAGRWLMVGVGGLSLLTAFGAIWLESRNTGVDAGANVSVQAGSHITNAPGKSSPAYAAEVARYNKKQAAEALSHNESFVGIPVTGTTSVAMPVTTQQERQAPIQEQPQAPIQEKREQRQPSQQPSSDESIASEFGAIAAAMKNERTVMPGVYIPHYEAVERPMGLEPVSSVPSVPEAAQAQQETETPAIRPGSIIYGVFENEMKSTLPGPVIGELVQGKYNGDRVIGSFARANGSNRLLIRMKTLVLPDGKTVSIDAYAVSPSTTLPGMATSVNYHLLSRTASFLGAAFLSGVEGYGSAVAQQGSTVVSSALGGATQTYPTLTPSQTMDIAAGQAAQQLQPVQQALVQNVMEPNTVTVAQGTPFGLLVVSSGASVASGAPTSPAASRAGNAAPLQSPAPETGNGATGQESSPRGIYPAPLTLPALSQDQERIVVR